MLPVFLPWAVLLITEYTTTEFCSFDLNPLSHELLSKGIILPCFSRARESWSRSHCLKPGIGDRVEYCVMFGNSCRSSSTTCFIRKLPRSTPLSPATKIGIDSLLNYFPIITISLVETSPVGKTRTRIARVSKTVKWSIPVFSRMNLIIVRMLLVKKAFISFNH